jgi:dihydroorotase
MQVLLQNGRLIDPLSGRDEQTDIHIVDGVIQRIGQQLSVPGVQVISVQGKVIAPGFIDMHVHFREPGFEHKETIETGTAAAAAGGFTAVCCMPNTNPPIDDASVVRFVKSKAASAHGGLVDVHPIGTVTLERKGEQLAPLVELAAEGAVGFSDDGDPVYDGEIMRRALEYSAMVDKPIIQHAQDLPMTKGGAMNEGFVATRIGLAGMPPVAEVSMVARDILLAEYTGGRYHVAHVSTAGTIALVRDAKSRGLKVTCEVAPHHFALTDEAVMGFDTNTKMNPPLRSSADVEALKNGLREGIIDAIASDHAPHSFDEKQVEFQLAPFGIIGLETALGVAVTELVVPGILTLSQLIEKFSVNPRRILRLPQVKIKEGEPANLTIFDPTAEWTVDPARMKSKSKNTPFGGRKLRGKPIGVINNGQVYWA